MGKNIRKALIVFVVSVVAFSHFASVGLAQDRHGELDENGGYMAVDLVVVRPFGIVATAVGAVLYVVSLPFSLAGGNEREACDALLVEPAKYTFKRPLGDF